MYHQRTIKWPQTGQPDYLVDSNRTQLKGFSLEEGILEVNFSGRYLITKASNWRKTLQQLVLTLTAIRVDKVGLVEGNQLYLHGTSFQDSLPHH